MLGIILFGVCVVTGTALGIKIIKYSKKYNRNKTIKMLRNDPELREEVKTHVFWDEIKI